MMDDNARLPSRCDAAAVMREALVGRRWSTRRRPRNGACAADRIVLSCKVSGVQDLISVYRDLAARCDYPLHLGLTEAGMGSKGIVASTAALSVLLQEGIGDTIRISLTPEAGRRPHARSHGGAGNPADHGPASFAPLVIACPGCGRTTSTTSRRHRRRPRPCPKSGSTRASASRSSTSTITRNGFAACWLRTRFTSGAVVTPWRR